MESKIGDHDVDKMKQVVHQAGKIKRAHSVALRNLMMQLRPTLTTKLARIKILKALVYERMHLVVYNELSDEDSKIFDKEFFEELTFNNDDSTIEICGVKFRICMLPCEVVDKLVGEEMYDIEPLQKYRSKYYRDDVKEEEKEAKKQKIDDE